VKLFGKVRAGQALEIAKQRRGVARDEGVARGDIAGAQPRQERFIGNISARSEGSALATDRAS